MENNKNENIETINDEAIETVFSELSETVLTENVFTGEIDEFNGKPSIVLEHRPFYSIIIPCYNSGKTLGYLLDSIVAQDMNDDIEVILADDCSPESYQDVVEKYNKTLSIKQIKTDYNFAPGNTREKGVSIAEGEWVCFADHDDEFIPETLKQVKQMILESGEDQFVITDFYEMNPDTREVIRNMEGTRNWMHAKFYNLDNFWGKYDIHFKKDLLTHEDICVSSQINCAVVMSGKEPAYFKIFTYCWMSRPTTISREKYGNHSFLEVFFRDYIESTGYTYYNQFLKYGMDVNYTFESMVEVLVYCYFYLQGIKFHQPDWLMENEQHCREYLLLIKEVFGVSNKFIYDFVAHDDADLYVKVRDSAYIGVGQHIESETFWQFLEKMHKDLPTRETMSEVIRKENL